VRWNTATTRADLWPAARALQRPLQPTRSLRERPEGTVPFQGRPVVTATREGLLLLKLYALPSLYRTATLE
jgi:hypothetical protein